MDTVLKQRIAAVVRNDPPKLWWERLESVLDEEAARKELAAAGLYAILEEAADQIGRGEEFATLDGNTAPNDDYAVVALCDVCGVYADPDTCLTVDDPEIHYGLGQVCPACWDEVGPAVQHRREARKAAENN